MALLRESSGLSQKALARKMATSRSHISRLERSKHSLRTTTVVRLAQAFNLSPHSFVSMVEAVLEEVYGDAAWRT